MACDDSRNLSLFLSGFEQGVYLISLVAGKLYVAHQCASLTWRLKSTLRYRSLPSTAISKLHLKLESTIQTAKAHHIKAAKTQLKKDTGQKKTIRVNKRTVGVISGLEFRQITKPRNQRTNTKVGFLCNSCLFCSAFLRLGTLAVWISHDK
jgi:hypothetical protein